MTKSGGGRLQFRVAFDQRAEVEDGHGNTEADWVEQFQCRAGYIHLRGGENVMAGRLSGKHPQIITVRASSQTRLITTAWQLRDARTGAVFNIRDVTHETDRQWISLLVESGVAT